MVLAWLMDNSNTDQRLEHHRNPPIIVPQEELYNNTGVEHFKIDPVSYKQSELLAKIRKERNYSYEDEIVCSVQCSEEFENKMKSFYTEHLHTDEEIRFVLEGSGYFDVRDADDQWIRIAVSAGDMIIIPAGIYHRFSLDMKNFIRVKRYFAGEPVWLPYNRPSDDMECRKEYLYSLSKRLAK